MNNNSEKEPFRIKPLEKFKYSYNCISPNLYNINLSTNDLYSCNKFRKIIDSKLKTLAIGNVDIIENTSVLFDRQLISRLQLVPVVCDNIDRWKDTIVYLSMECNLSHNRSLIVSSNHILSNNNNISFLNDLFLCKLNTGQKINLVATLSYNNKNKHAKHSFINSCILIDINKKNRIEGKGVLQIQLDDCYCIDKVLKEAYRIYYEYYLKSLKDQEMNQSDSYYI